MPTPEKFSASRFLTARMRYKLLVTLMTRCMLPSQPQQNGMESGKPFIFFQDEFSGMQEAYAVFISYNLIEFAIYSDLILLI